MKLLLAVLVGPALLAGCVEGVPEDAVVVDVVLSRYRFDPGTDASINATVGTVLVFRLTSADVTHGFAIEGVHPGVSVAPGETVEVRVKVDRPGTFRIYCTVFCGAGHPDHLGTLVVTAGA